MQVFSIHYRVHCRYVEEPALNPRTGCWAEKLIRRGEPQRAVTAAPHYCHGRIFVLTEVRCLATKLWKSINGYA